MDTRFLVLHKKIWSLLKHKHYSMITVGGTELSQNRTKKKRLTMGLNNREDKEHRDWMKIMSHQKFY